MIVQIPCLVGTYILDDKVTNLEGFIEIKKKRANPSD